METQIRTEFVSYFFVLGRVQGHFCNVLLYTFFVLNLSFKIEYEMEKKVFETNLNLVQLIKQPIMNPEFQFT